VPEWDGDLLRTFHLRQVKIVVGETLLICLCSEIVERHFMFMTSKLNLHSTF
jgi:hypothetical protein